MVAVALRIINLRTGDRMIGIGRTRLPLRGFYVAMLVLLYLPIALLFVFSLQRRHDPLVPALGLHHRVVRAR